MPQRTTFILHAILHAKFASRVPELKLHTKSDRKEFRRIDRTTVKIQENPNFICVFGKSSYQGVKGRKSAPEVGPQAPYFCFKEESGEK